MKITDPDIIKDGEKDLFESIKEDLDLNKIREIVKEKIVPESLTSEGGSIVVHNNQIAFTLDFTLHLRGSLMFDREGNYIPADASAAPELPAAEAADSDAGIREQGAPTAGDAEETAHAREESGHGDAEAFDEDGFEGNDLWELDDDLEGDESSIDEDIDDILKESRDFWEQKKE